MGQWVCGIGGSSSRIRQFNDHFRGIYRIYLESIKEKRKISTCNWVDILKRSILKPHESCSIHISSLIFLIFLISPPHCSHELGPMASATIKNSKLKPPMMESHLRFWLQRCLMNGRLWFFVCIFSADSWGHGSICRSVCPLDQCICTDNTFKARLSQEMCILPTYEMFSSSFCGQQSSAVPGKFLGIVGHDPSDSKSNRLHVDIFRFCFIPLRYIL